MRISKLFRRGAPAFDAPIAPNQSFCAIGDLHGRLDLLEAILPRLPDGPRVFVGDYVDRGEDSAGVLRRLFEMQREDPKKTICLKGNHEEMLLNFIAEPARRGSAWLGHGGLQTLASFGVAPPLGTDVSEAAWQEASAATVEAIGPDLLDWLEALPVLWQSGNVAVVHAGADPEEPMDMQLDNTLVWGHPKFEQVPREDGVWVVHGHTIHPDPQPILGRVPVDAGAYATGTLAAVHVSAGSMEYIKVTA